MLRHFQFSLPSVHKSGKSIIYTLHVERISLDLRVLLHN
uniref:Uncharacterized protein n=1 Tax=Anguilla anguilla TaxID=7936 RepID=A0A0E9S0I2_ANGAN